MGTSSLSPSPVKLRRVFCRLSRLVIQRRHTASIITSRKSAVIVIGDIVHVTSVQIVYPDEFVTYDIEEAVALSVRKAILGLVAHNRGHVPGTYIPFPGVGKSEGTPSSMTFTQMTYNM